jgi:tetratricopeptide (TPR) repeat protein
VADNDVMFGTAGFVGRTEARADVAHAIQRAESGRGAFVIVTGEPGIGKTSLVEQASEGLVTLWGRATETTVVPLGVWKQIVDAGARSGIALSPEDTIATAAVEPPAAGTGYERFLRFDAVIRTLREAARDQPFVVVLDDLQWADRESRLLLDLVVSELDSMALSVVGIARTQPGVDLPRATLTVELSGLPAPEIRALVGSIAGADPDDDVVAAAIELTAGNPFYLGEVARHLRSTGAALDAKSWRDVLPHGARSLLAHQFATLPRDAREALQAAAVLGATFDPSVLATVIGADRRGILASIEPAIVAGLLRDPRDGTLAFAHALVRDAALAELGLATRHELHERSAGGLEAVVGETAAAEIAAQWAAAGDRKLAARWWERAGRSAARMSMWAEACECFEHALAASDSPSAELQLRLAEAQAGIGWHDAARELFVKVARASRAAGDLEAFARAALGVGSIGGGFEIRVLDGAQIALLEAALTAAIPDLVRARILARLSVALTLDEDQERRIALAEEAVDLARTANDDAALVHALAAWCDAHAGPSQLAPRLEATAEMLVAATRSVDPELELLARRFRIVALMESGEVPLATAEIRAFARLADSLRQPVFQWYARLVEGMLALLHGDLDTAWELGTQSAAAGRRAGSANAHMLAEGGLLPAILRERGDNDQFLERMVAASSGYPEATRGYDFMYPLFLVGYGADPDTTREILERVPIDLEWPEADSLYLHVWTTIGNAAASVQARERAAVAWEHLLAHADRFALDGTASVCYGPVSATLARIATARGDVDEARRWFRIAIDSLVRADAPLLHARLTAELAALGETLSSPSPAGRPHDDEPCFRRDGDTWRLSFRGSTASLRDAKGLRDLATLLAKPDHEIHALDLVAASEGHGRGRAGADSDVGPALDAEARLAYEQRIRDLTETIEEAELGNDIERAARLDDERAALLRELGAALGLSGRDRSQSSDAERARKAVTMRIRDAIARIEHELPPLGNHLRHSVRTGIFCSYRPEHPVEWRLSPH